MVAWLLPAIIGAGASLVGGSLNRRSAKQQQQQAYSQDYDAAMRERKWYKDDRHNERTYDRAITRKDRIYAEQMRDNERDYAQSVLLDERAYDESRLAGDRTYMQRQLEDQRAYDADMYQRDVSQYHNDRNYMQKRADRLAEQSAASRGIDFTKLRDDAVAAGYNPMTALSMAHAYSRHVDYSVQGGVYSPGANYTTSNQGYSPVGGGAGGVGGGGAPAGAVMPSQAPASGSFQVGGGGYQSQFNPALASGSFVQEAIERGLDSWTNQPVENDPLADALRNAFQHDQMADQVRDSQIPGDFGYSLTKTQPFQPAGRVGVPALASDQSAIQPASMPSGEQQVGGRRFIPVQLPDGQFGKLQSSIARRLGIEPFDTVSAGDWAEIVGEVGEVETALVNDKIRNTSMDRGMLGPRVSPGIKDFYKSGTTGSSLMRSPSHLYNPWRQ